MKQYGLVFMTIVFTLVSMPAQAKDNWCVELRSGLASATQKLGETELESGIGIEGTIGYALMPHLSVYGGWGWNQFKPKPSSPNADYDFEETGYTFGLEFIHPFGNSDLSYLLRAGGIYNHIEIEDSEGTITSDSGHGFGWQIGVGLEIPLTSSLLFRPTVRYRSMSNDITINGVDTDFDLTYYSLGAGLAYSF